MKRGKIRKYNRKLYSKDYLSLLLSTKTDKIEWGEQFNALFITSMDSVFFNDESEGEVIINCNDIQLDDDDQPYTERIFFNKGKDEYFTPVQLFLNPKILQLKEDDEEYIEVSSDNINDDYVFKIQAKNNELIKSLQQILDLLETSTHIGITDYNDFVNKFVELLIENNMGWLKSVHAEMITSVLICDATTGQKLSFSDPKHLNNYIINRVSKSVMNAPISISLAFERINDQLADLKTYSKNRDSIMDFLFH